MTLKSEFQQPKAWASSKNSRCAKQKQALKFSAHESTQGKWQRNMIPCMKKEHIKQVPKWIPSKICR